MQQVDGFSGQAEHRPGLDHRGHGLERSGQALHRSLAFAWWGIGMRLAAFCWASDVALLLQAARETSSHLQVWAISELNDDNLQECINSLNAAQAILLHPSRQDPLFDRVVERIDRKIPVISLGLDPVLWSFSTVSSKIVSTANAYVVYEGEENAANMIRYIGRRFWGTTLTTSLPEKDLLAGPLPSRFR